MGAGNAQFRWQGNAQNLLFLKRNLAGGEGGIRTHRRGPENQKVAEIPGILIPRSPPESPDLALDLALGVSAYPLCARAQARDLARMLNNV
jgi:hypothetical protein